MDAPDRFAGKGKNMAEEEPLLVSPPTHEMAHHVADYSNFAGANALVRANKTFIDRILRSLQSEWE